MVAWSSWLPYTIRPNGFERDLLTTHALEGRFLPSISMIMRHSGLLLRGVRLRLSKLNFNGCSSKRRADNNNNNINIAIPPSLQNSFHDLGVFFSSSYSSLGRFSQTPTEPITRFHPSSTSVPLRYLSNKSSQKVNGSLPPASVSASDDDNDKDDEEENYSLQDKTSEEETSDGWEEEEEREPEIGDGGDGGGIVLGSVPWGERVLSIANEVLLQFGDDMKLFSFKTSPKGYIYVRLDNLSNNYGCPSKEEIEKYSCLYKTKLEEVGESGEIPDDLALEVSSPGAERLLKVPDDLYRFSDMPMSVHYMEGDSNHKGLQKDGIFMLESIETGLERCVWKMADVKENRDLSGKGRPLSRKQKDWRLALPFISVKRVTLYLEY